MYPSRGSARFGSVLARAFKEKARLGSARYVFEKARFLKNAQNEPKINYEAKIDMDFTYFCFGGLPPTVSVYNLHS